MKFQLVKKKLTISTTFLLLLLIQMGFTEMLLAISGNFFSAINKNIY